MFKRLEDWWFTTNPQAKPLYTIHLQEAPKDPHVDDEDSIRALATHPGFIALRNRLNLQRAALKQKLETEDHKEIREVIKLQSGIRWIGFLQTEVNKALGKKAEARAVAAKPYEQVEFDKVFTFYEGV